VFKCVEICCSVLQCVEMCGNVLKCVEMCGSVWKCVEMCGNVLKCVEMCGNVLKCVEMCGNVLKRFNMTDSQAACLQQTSFNYYLAIKSPLQWNLNGLQQLSFKSGFGGLEVACWPLVPKFTGVRTRPKPSDF